MPSVSKIQELIEIAWSHGFDVEGKAQLGGKLKNTAKWIGASDVCALFSWLHIRTELVDISKRPHTPTTTNSIGSTLYEYVRKYFEEEQAAGNKHVHPIYLQHDGHSRTIVGVEYGKTAANLLIYDPGTKRTQIDKMRQSDVAFKVMSLFRRSVNVFNKNKDYQLLVIRGTYATPADYEVGPFFL